MFLRITNILIVSISILWACVMCAFITSYDCMYIRIIASLTILLNLSSTIFCLQNDNKKQSLEIRIYVDNLSVLFLVIMFPKLLFYGYPIQVLFSVLITYCYLRKRTRVYDVLIYLSIAETVLYCILALDYPVLLLCNSVSMVLLISILFLLRQRLKLDPGTKFKRILLETNKILKHEIIQCITPMSYYIRNLDEQNKERMQVLIEKLTCIAQNNTSNFGHLITLIRSTISYTMQKNVTISYVDQTTKTLDIDSYTLLLVLYVIFESSISNMATEIIVKFNNKTIEIVDNSKGFDTKCKEFANSKLKSAIDLLELFDIPVIFSSIPDSGTIITMSTT